MSSVRQRHLSNLPPSSCYDESVAVSDENLTLIRMLDQRYTGTPFCGSLRMHPALRAADHIWNRKWVQRLMRLTY